MYEKMIIKHIDKAYIVMSLNGENIMCHDIKEIKIAYHYEDKLTIFKFGDCNRIDLPADSFVVVIKEINFSDRIYTSVERYNKGKVSSIMWEVG